MDNTPRTPREMPQDIIDAWDSFLSNRDDASRDILVSHYSRLVQSIAYTFFQKRPFILDHSDLVAAGNIGLLQALERYDPEHQRNASFETYAKLRVTGAILDQINDLDWTPRSVRKNIRSVIKAEGHSMTDADIEAMSGMNAAQINTARKQARRTYILPVDQETIRRMEGNGDGNDDRPTDIWWSVMNDLSVEERRVILLRFYRGETIEKTAKILGMSLNSVTSIQKRAIERLKKIFSIEP